MEEKASQKVLKMQENKSILITGSLDQQWSSYLSTRNLQVDVIPFIDIEYISDSLSVQQINETIGGQQIAVFTSSNAIHGVQKILKTKPTGWKIYCVGKVSEQLARSFWGDQVLSVNVNNSAELANMVAKQESSNIPVLFFCGDKRKDALPNLLTEAGFQLTEWIVYKNIATPEIVQKAYDAILFFSPSAVYSYYSKNQFPPNAQLWAIGATTAAALKEFTQQNIYTPLEQSKEQMIKEVAESI